MVPNSINNKLVSPHSSVDKVVSVNFSLISGHEFESPKQPEERRRRARLSQPELEKELLKL